MRWNETTTTLDEIGILYVNSTNERVTNQGLPITDITDEEYYVERIRPVLLNTPLGMLIYDGFKVFAVISHQQNVRVYPQPMLDKVISITRLFNFR